MMEEREELMVAPGGGKPTLRRAHFLKPTDSPTPQNHSTAPFPLASNTINGESTNGDVRVLYPGWRSLVTCTQKGWVDWVRKLQPVYGERWRKAGIFDAIMASKCLILRRNSSKNLLINLAHKWHPKTNTFLFSWGECTVSLEDVMVLGGLPALGQPARNPLKSYEMVGLEEKLREAHTIISRHSRQMPRGSTWFSYFHGGWGDDLEHAAFLVLWLSRYIFPGKYDLVAKDCFLIALNLSRGVQIALAPAVLASIYRDLGYLKKACLENVVQVLSLCSPLWLVQVWAWERFPYLSPAPNPIRFGEPRLSRWHDVDPLELEAVEIGRRLESDSGFRWRPYVGVLRNWDSRKVYNEKEGYADVVSGRGMVSEVVEVLVRCWRNSELVGMDCLEQYNPHRVARQFGFDQDVPAGAVERLNSAVSGWRHYNRPVGSDKLYMPARLFESGVTKSYQEAWNRANVVQD